MLYRYILLGLLSLASMAFACFSGYSNLLGRKKERVIFKALASLMFCSVAAAGAAFSGAALEPLYAALIISALVLGAAGDVLLTLNGYFGGKKGKRCETAGAVFFAGGHLLYIALFFSASAHVHYFLIPLAALFPVAVFLVAEKLAGIELGKFRVIAYAYSLILGLMLISVINYFLSYLGSERAYLVLIAGLLFVISDGAHIVKEYGPKKGNKKLVYTVLVTYYAAQCMFAFTLLL